MVLAPGDTMRLGVQVGRGGKRAPDVMYSLPSSPTHSWPSDLSYDWSSSDPDAVSISEAGLLTAIRLGRATIVFTADEARDSVTVAVRTIPVTDPIAYKKIGIGFGHTCALDRAGRAYCWGVNWHGELGTGVRRRLTRYLAPVAVIGNHKFTELAVGGLHTCAVSDTGGTFCWGDNLQGQLGNGTSGSSEFLARPTPISDDPEFGELAAGNGFSCGLTHQGQAHCWGANDSGQLGIGSSSGMQDNRSQPVPVQAEVVFSEVAAGGWHACGLTDAGVAYCWGGNNSGQVGRDHSRSEPSPGKVPTSIVFASLAAGGYHTCGLTADGTAYCWGDNMSGQLGDGTENNSHEPVQVSGGLKFTDLSLGSSHTCGISLSGDGYCWGSNWRGELGTGDLARKITPVPISGEVAFSITRAGSGSHTCALTPEGAAYCWGMGNLGSGKREYLPGTALYVYTAPTRVAEPL